LVGPSSPLFFSLRPPPGDAHTSTSGEKGRRGTFLFSPDHPLFSIAKSLSRSTPLSKGDFARVFPPPRKHQFFVRRSLLIGQQGVGHFSPGFSPPPLRTCLSRQAERIGAPYPLRRPPSFPFCGPSNGVSFFLHPPPFLLFFRPHVLDQTKFSSPAPPSSFVSPLLPPGGSGPSVPPPLFSDMEKLAAKFQPTDPPEPRVTASLPQVNLFFSVSGMSQWLGEWIPFLHLSPTSFPPVLLF